jgi:hypothetical protein
MHRKGLAISPLRLTTRLPGRGFDETINHRQGGACGVCRAWRLRVRVVCTVQRHPDRDTHEHAERDRHADQYPDEYSDEHTHRDAHGDCYADKHADGDSNQYPNPNGNPNGDAHTDRDRNAGTDGHAQDCHGYPYGHYRDPDADSSDHAATDSGARDRTASDGGTTHGSTHGQDDTRATQDRDARPGGWRLTCRHCGDIRNLQRQREAPRSQRGASSCHRRPQTAYCMLLLPRRGVSSRVRGRRLLDAVALAVTRLTRRAVSAAVHTVCRGDLCVRCPSRHSEGQRDRCQEP